MTFASRVSPQKKECWTEFFSVRCMHMWASSGKCHVQMQRQLTNMIMHECFPNRRTAAPSATSPLDDDDDDEHASGGRLVRLCWCCDGHNWIRKYHRRCHRRVPTTCKRSAHCWRWVRTSIRYQTSGGCRHRGSPSGCSRLMFGILERSLWKWRPFSEESFLEVDATA